MWYGILYDFTPLTNGVIFFQSMYLHTVRFYTVKILQCLHRCRRWRKIVQSVDWVSHTLRRYPITVRVFVFGRFFVSSSLGSTVEPRLSELFLWFEFCHEYLLIMIKIRSHILFKNYCIDIARNQGHFEPANNYQLYIVLHSGTIEYQENSK